MNPGCQAFNTSVATDMAFVLHRAQIDCKTDKMSNWSEFNNHLYQDNTKRASIVGQSTLMNAKADGHNNIYNVGERCKFITRKRGVDGKITQITCDQGINRPHIRLQCVIILLDLSLSCGSRSASLQRELQTRYSEEETTRAQ